MKIQNTGEVAPQIYYIFLNFEGLFNQVNGNNYKLNHKLISAGMSNLFDPQKAKDFISGAIDYLPFVATATDTNTPASFMLNIIHNYAIEYELECCRKICYKQLPSRFSGIFAFGDYKSCLEVSRKYNWDIKTVKKFKIIEGIKIAKLNMEIVSMLRGIFIEAIPINERQDIYRSYWEGQGNIHFNPSLTTSTIENDVIYEYLIEGILEEIEE